MTAQVIYLHTRRPIVVAQAEPVSGGLFRAIILAAPLCLAAWYGIYRTVVWLAERVMAGLV